MSEQYVISTQQVSSNKFGNVDLCELLEEQSDTKDSDSIFVKFRVKQIKMSLFISPDNENICLADQSGNLNCHFSLRTHQTVFISKRILLILPRDSDNAESNCLRFYSAKEARDFEKAVKLCLLLKPGSSGLNKKRDGLFESRTETNSADLYFQFYGYLSQQQNMLQDFVRTSTYQHAILSNTSDFEGKVVLDVGTGTGALAFFAVQSGAAKVYAIEASTMAIYCQELVRTNNLNDKIVVLPGKVEDILPEQLAGQVDVLISEPMGYSLVNERMLESYVFARKFLKPGGRMFPSTSTMYFSLFSDELVYQECVQKSNFWFNKSFYGIDLSALKSQAFSEVFRQPVIDTWPPNILCSDVCSWSFDFEKDPVEKLHVIEVPFELTATRSCLMHGIGSWFDVWFNGSELSIVLSTSPDQPLTHWYQLVKTVTKTKKTESSTPRSRRRRIEKDICREKAIYVRYFFTEPFIVHSGAIIKGRITFTANERLSYDVDIYASLNGVEKSNRLDLKNPCFRYMSGGSAQMPAPNFYNPTQNGSEEQQAVATDEAYSSQNLGNIDSTPNNALSMSYENIPCEESTVQH